MFSCPNPNDFIAASLSFAVKSVTFLGRAAVDSFSDTSASIDTSYCGAV